MLQSDFAMNEIGLFEVKLWYMNPILSTCFVSFDVFAGFTYAKIRKYKHS